MKHALTCDGQLVLRQASQAGDPVDTFCDVQATTPASTEVPLDPEVLEPLLPLVPLLPLDPLDPLVLPPELVVPLDAAPLVDVLLLPPLVPLDPLLLLALLPLDPPLLLEALLPTPSGAIFPPQLAASNASATPATKTCDPRARFVMGHP